VAERKAAANTLKALAEDWYAELAPARSPIWRDSTRRWLDKRIYPSFGTRPADSITTTEILGFIKGIRQKKTAESIRQLLSRVFRYGVLHERGKSDPAHACRGAIVVPQAEHHKPLPAKEIPDFYERLKAYSGLPGTKELASRPE
jgi:integrase